jgi:hypothetical protein
MTAVSVNTIGALSFKVNELVEGTPETEEVKSAVPDTPAEVILIVRVDPTPEPVVLKVIHVRQLLPGLRVIIVCAWAGTELNDKQIAKTTKPNSVFRILFPLEKPNQP